MDGNGCSLAEAPGFRAEANRTGNNSATVRLRGDLDIASAGVARRALEQLGAGIQQIVLDLSHITFCDAAGVRFLLTAQEQARTTGRNLVVRHPSRPVRRVLAITGDLICPAGLSADEGPEPADLRHPATANSSPTGSAWSIWWWCVRVRAELDVPRPVTGAAQRPRQPPDLPMSARGGVESTAWPPRQRFSQSWKAGLGSGCHGRQAGSA